VSGLVVQAGEFAARVVCAQQALDSFDGGEGVVDRPVEFSLAQTGRPDLNERPEQRPATADFSV
jgi:hypothetical protein